MKAMQDFTHDPRFELVRRLNIQIHKHPFDPSESIGIQHNIAKHILPESSGRMVVPTIYGFNLIIDLDHSHTESMQGSIERNLYFLGTYEMGTLEVIRRSLATRGNGATFVEVGAHNGLMSIYASLVGKAAKVFSFEPNPPMFELLKANLELNHCINVTPLALALGDRQETASIEIDTENSGAAHISKSTEAERAIPIDTLDRVAKDNNIGPVHLMLIDVEGYEHNVLMGAEEILSKYKPDLIVEYTPKNSDTKVIDMLHRHGYQIYILEHSRHLPGKLIPLKMVKDNANNYFCFQPERAKTLGLTV